MKRRRSLLPFRRGIYPSFQSYQFVLSIVQMLTGRCDRLGLGAPLPAKSNGQDGAPTRGDGNLEENEKLKKQLLGRNYKRVLKERDATLASSRQKGSASVSGAPVDNRGLDGPAEGKEEEDDGEDEEGRASLVGKKEDNKKRKVDSAPGQAGTSEVEDTQHGDGFRAAPARGRKKKATSFLDEVLAERSKKKKKR